MAPPYAGRRRLVVVPVLCAVALASCTATPVRHASGSARPTSSGPTGHPARRHEVAPGRVIGPWQATTVGGPIGRAVPLAGTRTSLYLRDGPDVVRVDAASKRVTARRPAPTALG